MKTKIKKILAVSGLGIAIGGIAPQALADHDGGGAFLGAFFGSTLGAALGTQYAPPPREVVVVRHDYYEEAPPPQVVVVHRPYYYAPEREVVVVHGHEHRYVRHAWRDHDDWGDDD